MSFKILLTVAILSLSSTTSWSKVYLIKHWHLSPGTLTYPTTKTAIPQAEHFKDTLIQIAPLLKGKQALPVWVEGCEGVIDATHADDFKTAFNGWSFSEAKKQIASTPMTHIGFLMESKFSNEAQVECADDLKIHKESLATLSDLRAVAGYLTRLQEFKDQPKKQKIYLEGVIEMYKMNPKSTSADAVSALKKDLKENLDRFEAQIEKRNQAVVDRIKKQSQKTDSIVIYGGMHIAGLEKSLKKLKIETEIITPVGYPADGDLFLEKLRESLR